MPLLARRRPDRKSARRRRLVGALTVAALAVPGLVILDASSASASEITSTGPLTLVGISPDLNCSVNHEGDTSPEFFGATACGTFFATGDNLYGPESVPAGGGATSSAGYVPLTPTSQTSGGSGTSADPYVVTTVVGLGTSGMTITQKDSYVAGQESYRTDTTVTNTGSTSVSGFLYKAADCYLQNSDAGFGRYDSATGAISCVAVDTSSGTPQPGTRIEQFYPLSPDSHYFESFYSTVWAAVGAKTQLPDQCGQCANQVDNGAGLSWGLTLAAGASLTKSHLTTFSPLGITPMTTTKTADAGSAVAGGSDGYTITVHNPNTTAETVTSITDTLPAGFSYTAGSSTGATTTNPTVSGQQLTWPGSFPVAPGADLTLHFSVTVSGTAGTYYNNAGGTATDLAVAPTGDTAPVSVTPVAPVNHPPTANGQSVSTPQDTAKAVTLTGSDPDGDSLTYAVATQPAHGTLSGTGPNLTYTPAAGYTGADAFTFTVNDGQVTSAPATVAITVTAVNHPPTATGQSVSTPQDTAKAITLTGSDPDGDTLTYAVASQPAHGTLSGTGPNLTYTPAAGYTGADSFTFTVTDGAASSAPATVAITVTAVNHPPTAAGQSVSTAQDTAKAITLTGNDPDGDTLTYAVASQPAHGTLTGTGPNLTYTPAAGYTGADAFTFTVNDGAAGSAPATVHITVTPVSTGCTSQAPTVDNTVSVDQKKAAKTITASHLSTTGPGELLVAMVEADGPAVNGAQKVTSLTGGGLTWTLVTRSNKTWGTAEVWQAYATSTLTDATIKATLRSAYDGSMTVTAFTGAAHQVGASGSAGARKGVPTVSLTPHACGSLVWAAGHNWDPARTITTGTGQSLIHVFKDLRVNDTFWTMKADHPAATTAPVTLTVGGITTDRWQLVAVEIPAAD